MNSKLKPCPFCGGKARFGQALTENYEFVKWIACKECYACTGRSKVRAEVVRAWNRRDRLESSENPE